MTKYAIVEDGGRQYRVEEGQQIEIDYREVEPGQEIRFERVLAYRDENGLLIGKPTLDSVTVVAEAIEHFKGPKILVQKFRRRENYHPTRGHRQRLLRAKITKIEVR